MISVRSITVLVAVGSLGLASATQAAGTPAGTNIQNTARVSYQVGGSTLTAASNTSSVTVAEILDAVLTIAAATAPVSPGATQEELLFTLTNTGNGSETFDLIALSAGIGSDDFDPVLSAPSMYFDSDASGDFSAADQAYVPGTNDPVLAADATLAILVINNIPATALDGNRGRSQLTVRARTGTGTPGTAFVGQGDGGVDAVAGSSGGDSELYGEYVLSGVQLQAVKSQTIVDQFGGARPVPGARIDYQIVITPSGAGTASSVMFSDLIPTSTTYVAGSLELNNATQTDIADGDLGDFTTAPQAQVRINLGDLTAASGAQTIEFAVTIN